MDERYTPLDAEQLAELATQLRDQARMVRSVFEAYTEAGFTSAESLRLTQTWMQITFGNASAS